MAVGQSRARQRRGTRAAEKRPSGRAAERPSRAAASVLSFKLKLSHCTSPYKCMPFLEYLFYMVGTRAAEQTDSPPSKLASRVARRFWGGSGSFLASPSSLLLAVPLSRASGAALLVPSLCRASFLGKWLSSLCRVARITTRHRRRRSSQCNDCAASGSFSEISG